MKVVFLEDVPGTAKIGDIKEVKAGFARNYLLPRRIAMAATPAVVKSAEARAVREARLQEARDNEARTLAGKIEASPVTVTARAGSTGKLFGSVGTAEIAARAAEILGQAEFARHDVLLPEPIKELGDFQVRLRLTRNVNAMLAVTVIGEDGTTAADIRAKADGATDEAPAPAEADASSDAAEDDAGTAEDDAEAAGDETPEE